MLITSLQISLSCTLEASDIRIAHEAFATADRAQFRNPVTWRLPKSSAGELDLISIGFCRVQRSRSVDLGAMEMKS